MKLHRHQLAFAAVLLLAACAEDRNAPGAPSNDSDVSSPEAPAEEPTATKTPDSFKTETLDGVRIHGQLYASGLDSSATLILAFHQGGSNGGGEYGAIAPWLNENGYRVIAWDQRAGGELYGSTNRTVEGLPAGTPDGYCDAYADLQAALNYVLSHDLGDDVVVWGSSYSAALVFQLAARNPEHVGGVIAFSPASGDPLSACLARSSVADVQAPMLVVRPASEMQRDSSIEQREILTAAGVEFHVIENGIHGSSMLVDARTENDMSAARAAVIAWLKELD